MNITEILHFTLGYN